VTAPAGARAVVPSPARVRTAYLEELGPQERAVLWSWLGFTGTFAAVRAITYSIRSGVGPFRNLSLGVRTCTTTCGASPR
jgi:hypothetical protein